eukprot:gene16408-34258_t
MRSIFAVILLIVSILSVQAFIPSGMKLNLLTKITTAQTDSTALMACRKNNKIEKRRRNREYARKFASKTGGSRRKTVIDAKRLVVAASEEKFQAEVYKMTTDEDMPNYTAFDFA